MLVHSGVGRVRLRASYIFPVACLQVVVLDIYRDVFCGGKPFTAFHVCWTRLAPWVFILNRTGSTE